MIDLVLFEPEIPPNTGNIIRLTANTGFRLHLIEPLGFDLSEKSVRRAGLDYRDMARVEKHPNITAFLDQHRQRYPTAHRYACTTKGHKDHTTPAYRENDAFIFGPETRGLPPSVLNDSDNYQLIRVPMQAGARSLNLSNSVAIVAYEAWRQLDFANAQ